MGIHTSNLGEVTRTYEEGHEPIPWNSRGIGLDGTPGCFVCGVEWRNEEAKARGNDYMNNVAALLSKKDEEAALACFDRGARMDYYHADRNVPQIKVGACDEHLKVLQHLSEQWFISKIRVRRLVQLFRPREGS